MGNSVFGSIMKLIRLLVEAAIEWDFRKRTRTGGLDDFNEYDDPC
jgi:hypothetical protein